MTTRRDFLAGCSILVAAAALEPAALFAANTRPGAAFLGPLCLSSFARQVGTAFRLARAGQPTLRLVLAEARALPVPELSDPAGRVDGERRFSLLFRGPGDAPLKQDTYAFDHPVLGRLAIFIVPVWMRDGVHQYYEAIFHTHSGPVV